MKKQSTTKTKTKPIRKPVKRPNVRMKHLEVIKNFNENGGSMGEAMRKAGYSKNTANTPQKITNSVTFRELLDELMPEDYITRKHKELLESKMLLNLHFPEDTGDEEIRQIVEDAGGKLIRVVVSEVTYPGKAGKEDITVVKKIAYYAVHNAMAQDKALDKLYKLRGEYAPEKRTVKHEGFSLEELFKGDYE